MPRPDDWFYSYGIEEEVGSGVHEFLSKHPEVKRSDIFITTKVWVHLYEPEDVEWCLNDSLKKLGEEYVDLLLLHWPFAAERTEDYQVKLTPDNKVLACTMSIYFHYDHTYKLQSILLRRGSQPTLSQHGGPWRNSTSKEKQNLLAFPTFPSSNSSRWQSMQRFLQR